MKLREGQTPGEEGGIDTRIFCSRGRAGGAGHCRVWCSRETAVWGAGRCRVWCSREIAGGAGHCRPCCSRGRADRGAGARGQGCRRGTGRKCTLAFPSIHASTRSPLRSASYILHSFSTSHIHPCIPSLHTDREQPVCSSLPPSAFRENVLCVWV